MDFFGHIGSAFEHMGSASSSVSAGKPIGQFQHDDDDLCMAQKAEEVYVLIRPIKTVPDQMVGVFRALTGNDPMTHFAFLLRTGDRFFVLERVLSNLSLRPVATWEIKGLAKGSRMKLGSHTSMESFIRDEENRDYDFVGNNCKHFAHKFYWDYSERSSFAGGDSLDFPSLCGYLEHLERLDGEAAVAAM